MDLISPILIFWTFIDLSVCVIAANKTKEVCYAQVGCFNLEPPWVTSTRILPAPESPDRIKVQFYLTTRNTKEKSIKEWKITTTKFHQPSMDSLMKLDYRPRNRTVIQIHGMYHSSKWSWDLQKQIARAYLTVEDVNIFFVEYNGEVLHVPYTQLVANIRVIGVIAARFLEQLMQATNLTVNQMHVIGFSMGGHIAGYIGKRIPHINRMTALDPAQPQFENADPRYRLHRTDADHVDVLHTNTKRFVPFFGLGYKPPVGHVDFYFNAGTEQPGCAVNLKKVVNKFLKFDMKDAFLDGYLVFICSHLKVIEYWSEALTNTNCTMWGVERSFTNRRKNSTQIQVNQRVRQYDCAIHKCAPVGLDTFKYVQSGRFDVPTKLTSPYCVPQIWYTSAGWLLNFTYDYTSRYLKALHDAV